MNLHTLLATIYLSASLHLASLWSGYSTRIRQKLGLPWREKDASPSPVGQEADEEAYTMQPSPGNEFVPAEGLPGLLAGARVSESPNLG